VDLLICGYMWFILFLNYYIIKHEVRVQNNVFNGLALGVSEIIACMFGAWLAEKLGRLGALTLFYTIGGVMCIISVAFAVSQEDENLKEINNLIYSIVL